MDPLAAQAAATMQRLYLRSVVGILAQKTDVTPDGPVIKKRFLGSGFIIIHKKLQANSFLVITCWHVINDLRTNEGEHLMVRLPGTTEDIDAHPHESNRGFDIQVVSVRVPPERQILVGQFPCVQFSAPAPPVPLGALVATMGYYNPINLPLYLKIDGPLFSTEPSAYGGYIVGPEDHTQKAGIVVQQSCYGIRGASGGPLIRCDTGRAIGVFTSVTGIIGEAVSTQCVWVLLGKWLQRNSIGINNNNTIQERIDMCGALY